jgi:hypothetical protein
MDGVTGTNDSFGLIISLIYPERFLVTAAPPIEPASRVT